MSVTLKTGETLWSASGTHIWDDNGYAIKCTEDTIVTFDSSEIETASLVFIHADRVFRDCDPDTGLPNEGGE
jgi:hypothetical protein